MGRYSYIFIYLEEISGRLIGGLLTPLRDLSELIMTGHSLPLRTRYHVNHISVASSTSWLSLVNHSDNSPVDEGPFSWPYDKLDDHLVCIVYWLRPLSSCFSLTLRGSFSVPSQLHCMMCNWRFLARIKVPKLLRYAGITQRHSQDNTAFLMTISTFGYTAI